MSERFYHQQKLTRTEMMLKTGKMKPKRRLKSDIIKSIQTMLECDLKSFDKMTVADLTELEKVIEKGVYQ
jgi:hypothetical protein